MSGLRQLGPEAVRRFLRHVVGLDVRPDGPVDVWAEPKTTWIPPAGAERGVVVSVAGRVVPGAWTEDPAWGESRPDAVITADETLVVFEFKTPRQSVKSTQLLRHAASAALAVEAARGPFGEGEHRSGFVAATWEDIGGWLAAEVSLSDADAEAARLQSDLITAGYCSDAAVPPRLAPAVTVSRRPRPRATPVAEIAQLWDLDAVRRICWARYGSEPVKGADCVEESRRLQTAFEAAGQPVPLGIRFGGPLGGMPPERVLSHMYGLASGTTRRALPNAYPMTWTGFSERTVGSGADQAVLVALLALARSQARGGAAWQRVLEFVPVCWSIAPPWVPGLDALHDVLKPARKG